MKLKDSEDINGLKYDVWMWHLFVLRMLLEEIKGLIYSLKCYQCNLVMPSLVFHLMQIPWQNPGGGQMPRAARIYFDCWTMVQMYALSYCMIACTGGWGLQSSCAGMVKMNRVSSSMLLVWSTWSVVQCFSLFSCLVLFQVVETWNLNCLSSLRVVFKSELDFDFVMHEHTKLF